MASFYKHDIEAWSRATISLSDRDYRVYHVIVCEIMRAEAPILNHDRMLAGLTNRSTRDVRAAIAALEAAGLILVSHGFIDNKRCAEELAELRDAKRRAAHSRSVGRGFSSNSTSVHDQLTDHSPSVRDQFDNFSTPELGGNANEINGNSLVDRGETKTKTKKEREGITPPSLPSVEKPPLSPVGEGGGLSAGQGLGDPVPASASRPVPRPREVTPPSDAHPAGKAAKPAKHKGGDGIAILRAAGVQQQSIDAWIAVRKAKQGGASISQISADDLIKQAAAAGISPDEAVRESVTRGWRGFRAAWLNERRAAERVDTSGNAAVTLDGATSEPIHASPSFGDTHGTRRYAPRPDRRPGDIDGPALLQTARELARRAFDRNPVGDEAG